MDGWLSLAGIVWRSAVPVFLGLALLTACLAYVVSRRPLHGLPALTLLLGAGCAVAGAGSQTCCVPDRCNLLNIAPTYIRSTMILGWQWVAEHRDQGTIAYTGNNVPYPLFGDHLTNGVHYVNIDRHRTWRLHDYDRAHRRGRHDPPPIAPLAIRSGVLTPLPGPSRWHVDAVRARSA